ncbi:hypothetical protein [Holospora undulata]|uniref:Uncharacterized protein n=1 Tax=Holospora undulata HU1 TaxID=1321371 RepID=A0A061JIP1_9PROT|nr:hypothetical protein [Holospora undulata]ETZ04969.1 hypothetical protein K737_300614 [Holospora undulata HU1]
MKNLDYKKFFLSVFLINVWNKGLCVFRSELADRLDQCTDNVNYINNALTHKEKVTHELSQEEAVDFIEAKELMKNESIYELFKLASDAKKYTKYLEEILNEYQNNTIQDLESLKENLPKLLEMQKILQSFSITKNEELKYVLENLTKINALKKEIVQIKIKSRYENSLDGQNKEEEINRLLDGFRFIKSPEQGIVSEETANQEPSTDNQEPSTDNQEPSTANQETQNLTSAISDDTQDTSSNQSFIQNDSKPKPKTYVEHTKGFNQGINKEVEDMNNNAKSLAGAMAGAYYDETDTTDAGIRKILTEQEKSIEDRLQRRKKKEGKNSEISTAANSEISTADSAQSVNSQNQAQAVQSSEVSVQEPSYNLKTEGDLHKAQTNIEKTSKMSAELPTPNNIKEEQNQNNDSVILKQIDFNKTNEVTDGSSLSSLNSPTSQDTSFQAQKSQILDNSLSMEGSNKAALQNQAQTQLEDSAQLATSLSVNPQNQQQDSLPEKPLSSIPETSVILKEIVNLENDNKISKINEYIKLIKFECKKIENEMGQITKKLSKLTKTAENNTDLEYEKNQLKNKAEKLEKFTAQKEELQKENENIRSIKRKELQKENENIRSIKRKELQKENENIRSIKIESQSFDTSKSKNKKNKP